MATGTMLKLQTILLICFLSFSLSAQNSVWDSETITIEDGLRSNAVTAILKDHQGFMWFGTKMGLHRFDGYQFKTYKYEVAGTASLSANRVFDLYEDRDGNLWIATTNGLNKLDLKKDQIVHYLHDPEDTMSISEGEVRRIFVDKLGTVWAGTVQGLNRFDKDTETFIRYLSEPKDPNSISGNDVTCIYEDREGAFWIGTLMNGLNKMNRTTGVFQRILMSPADTLSWNNRVNCIYEDRSANFWVGTGEGLFLFNRKDNSFSRVLHNENNPHAPRSQIFSAVYEDFDGNYWIRTYSGLYLFDLRMKRINAWEHATRNPIVSPWGNTKSIYQDSTGILWYSKHYRGIEKLIPKNKKFRYYRNNPSLKKTEVTCVYVENKDIIWMGTFEGLSRFDRKKNTYQLFRQNPEDPNAISYKGITGIFRDHKGSLWVSTRNGLNRVERSGNNTYRFIQYKHNPDNPASIAGDWVDQIYEDHSGRLFFHFNGGNIDIFDREKEAFFHMDYSAYNLRNFIFGQIHLMEPDRIWAGNRGNGLSEIILPLGRSGRYTITPDTIIQYKSKPGGLNDNTVSCMYKDLSGTYWIGTEGGGLNKMEKIGRNKMGYNEYQFEYFTKANGLCGDDIGPILEDEKGRLWLGTENGISRFDPVTEIFTNYDKTDGLLNRSFHSGAYKAPDGEMFFSTDNGLLAFYPDSIKDNSIIPPVVITDFKIFNEAVLIGGKSPLQTSISSATEINLPYDQNFLSFEFAALSYLNPEKNQYKYKMEGLDPAWIEAGARRRTDYPDLKPGDYIFKVIGSNNNGIWNKEGVSLKIIVYPPWWATYYAYVGYAFLVIILFFGYVRWRTWQIEGEKDKLEKQVRQRTHQIEEHQEEIESQKELLEERNRKILEMDEMKTKFFNNVSHEFRTPLTLIQGPVEDLMTNARLNKKEHHKLQMISRNADRLLNLVNQLLNIAKLDSGNMKMNLTEGDIMESLRIITGSFLSLAETGGILFNRSIPRDSRKTWFDPGILEKIIVNILSNAFKYTPEGGEIAFKAQWIKAKTNGSPDMIEFSVSDQGPGIPENLTDKIFTRFYQVEGKSHHFTVGTGIGLSLVHDLVNLIHGEIMVESEIDKGSTFIVRFPLGKKHLSKSEFVISEEKEKIQRIVSEPEETIHQTSGSSEKVNLYAKKKELPIVLIVEDNGEIRSHIAENLKNEYQLFEAVNGSAGLKKAREIIPDLVITDLIMPLMDGVEMCSQIKNDERTSHIPIIMLTAKSSLEDKLVGLETGADDYLSKPFHMKELLTRIANLIEQRRKLRERFSREITLEPREISITSLDEIFLKRAIETVEMHLNDENFDINEFQDTMHMSHSTLFRKLYALTNQSPSGFIRNIRLKRAAQLLSAHFGNVAKISYEVGFNNPAYFSKCFKTLFGISPLDYSKNGQRSEVPKI